jgi:hypothetical protein
MSSHVIVPMETRPIFTNDRNPCWTAWDARDASYVRAKNARGQRETWPFNPSYGNEADLHYEMNKVTGMEGDPRARRRNLVW